MEKKLDLNIYTPDAEFTPNLHYMDENFIGLFLDFKRISLTILMLL